ncbi:hypothetical protein ABI59_03990 [Acidobacteria bacterium Mor1]|nr:hypothetical protein ABI59_03990 [Acidobacteria bacterium Mor1]
MKKLFYLGFCLVLMTGFGCAITNYALITDNNQTSAGGGAGEIRDTFGKAKLVHASQWATSQADGIDELLNFVNQLSDGSQTLYTHNNFSVAGDATFSDDLYCSPETKGCAAVVAKDADPTDPNEDPFLSRLNDECPGARSLSLSLSTGRYYGECGRTGTWSLQDKLSMYNMGEMGEMFGRDVLMYNLNASNFDVRLNNNAGIVTSLPVSGEATAALSLNGQINGLLDASNPLLGNMLLNYAAWLQTNGGEMTTITVTYNGISRSFDVQGHTNTGIGTVSRIMYNAHNKF